MNVIAKWNGHIGYTKCQLVLGSVVEPTGASLD